MKFDFQGGTINDHIHDIVERFIVYLGTVVDDKLHWNRNTETIYSKASQRLYFLRKLKKLVFTVLSCG